MTKKALVLGGGGSVGVAWEIALLAGLLEGGCDVRDADVVVGTSAGSVVGRWVAHGHDLLARMKDRGRSESPSSAPPVIRHDPEITPEVFRTWGSTEVMTPERAAEVGALARKAKVATREEMLAGFIDDGSGWPERPFFVCATDCESGELRTFTRDDGVAINVAIAASCSVPGLFPPIEMHGRWYTDGGVRSWTSADVVLPFAPDRVLIISPGSLKDAPGTRGLASRQLEAESQLLRDGGIDVRSIELDEATRAVGQNLMDPESAARSGETGYEQGKRLAADIGAWWSA